MVDESSREEVVDHKSEGGCDDSKDDFSNGELSSFDIDFNFCGFGFVSQWV